MAKLNFFLNNSQTEVPADDVDLSMTCGNAIRELENSGQVPTPKEGYGYRILDKRNTLANDSDTLADAGFEDGDTVNVVMKATGAYDDWTNDDPADLGNDGGQSDEGPAGAGG